MPVQVDRAPLQVGVQLFGTGEEVGQRHRLAAKVEQRGVAAAETERDPPATLLLHGRGNGRERGRVARRRIRHPGHELQPLRHLGAERHRHERVAYEVLRVGERDAVPTSFLGPSRQHLGKPGLGKAHRVQHGHASYLLFASLAGR